MSVLGRYIVDAVLIERRSPTELARSHGISRRWVHKLVKRFNQGGYAALEPRSRRPHSCSHQTSDGVQAQVLSLRQELVADGHDAGPETIAHHLIGRVDKLPSAATIWRILKRHGLISPQPHKRPRSSFIRFEAKLPNETWQLDATPWQLANGTPVEILNFLDDRSRLALASTCFPSLKADDVVRVFWSASNSFGRPASLLSDNAAVFSGRSRPGQGPARARVGATGHPLQALDSLSPSDLRQSRALPPNPQTISAPAAVGSVAHGVAVPARRLSRLLQPASATSCAQSPDTARRFQFAPQGSTRTTTCGQRPTGSPRQDRFLWQSHPSISGPPPTHPSRHSPQEPSGPTPGRRAGRAHPHRRRRVDPRSDHRPNPQLPAARRPLARAQCLATGENYVLREDIGSPGGIRGNVRYTDSPLPAGRTGLGLSPGGKS
jgi:hypothetical protein